MEEAVVLRCINCGHMWTLDATSDIRATLTYSCPVCEFPVSMHAAPAAGQILTADDLAQRLGALMADARAAAIDDETIIQVLSDELEFVAELAHAGRNMCVQVIDLGPLEEPVFARPVRDRSTILRRRALG